VHMHQLIKVIDTHLGNENEYIFDAKVSIYDFNELMHMHLDDTDYETLGGFVYAQLDKIPNTGDAVTFDHVTFTVLAKRGRRIMKIRVQRYRPEREKETDTKSHLSVLPSLEEREQHIHQVNHEIPQANEEASRYKV